MWAWLFYFDGCSGLVILQVNDVCAHLVALLFNSIKVISTLTALTSHDFEGL